jgi:hypothetical protein
MGQGRYEGRFLSRYQINVCDSCYSGNWDGWSPHFELKILKILEEKGISLPQRNEKGFLPRD